MLVAAGGPVSAFAAQQATAAQPLPKTPVVFTSVTDPVGSGLYVAGGNLTGIAGMTTEMDAARLRLLQLPAAWPSFSMGSQRGAR